MPIPMPSPTPQGAPQGNPPSVGSSPATIPQPNRGNEAAGLARLGIIVRLMEETVPLIGASSEPGKELLRALSSLAKHVPPGAVSPSIEQNAMQKMAMQQRQMGPQIAAMRQMGAGGSPSGAPPQPSSPPSGESE